MGDCRYCGKPAGFFRKKHDECETEFLNQQRKIESGRLMIQQEAMKAIKTASDYDALDRVVAEIQNDSKVEKEEIKALLAKGWEDAVDTFLDDGLLDEDEEKRLMAFKSQYSLGQDDLDRNGAFTKTAKAAILRDVLDGTLPERVKIDGSLPINLQKGEQIVWAFAGAQYLEDKTKRTFEGRSQGASVRVMKGVYYRVGAFKGRPVEKTERVHIDTGWVVLTNKNVYFAGPAKSVRIPYYKVVSFEPFSDGFGLMRDATTAKPQIFVTGDGWFSYNLVTNLARL